MLWFVANANKEIWFDLKGSGKDIPYVGFHRIYTPRIRRCITSYSVYSFWIWVYSNRHLSSHFHLCFSPHTENLLDLSLSFSLSLPATIECLAWPYSIQVLVPLSLTPSGLLPVSLVALFSPSVLCGNFLPLLACPRTSLHSGSILGEV